jgi:hypothetical protein
MAKVANKAKEQLAEAKKMIQALKAQIRDLKTSHKKELTEKVEAAYEKAVQMAFSEFESKEDARHAVVEKAVDKALADFEKAYAKKFAKKKPAKKAVAKKAPAKKAAPKKAKAKKAAPKKA